jgi:hypothetical protein
MSDYGFPEKRNKQKDKRKDKKKHPYKTGGRQRSFDLKTK